MAPSGHEGAADVRPKRYLLEMLPELVKYPRTLHLEGSRLPQGGKDPDQVAFATVAGKHLVVEEKLDGTQAGISFNASGEMFVQTRGRFVTGGPADREFSRLKAWANEHLFELLDVLEDRYVLYGEWLAAKHTVFYDLLPHYFLEFDVYDRVSGEFLSTERRRQLLAQTPVISVPVVHDGVVDDLVTLKALVRPSLYKSEQWRRALQEEALAAGAIPSVVAKETDQTVYGEGLYIKWEEDGRVAGRYKWVRADFVRLILQKQAPPA